MSSLLRARLALAAAGLVFLLSACGGAVDNAGASTTVSGAEVASPSSSASTAASPRTTEALLAQGAKLNAASLSEAEAQALAADRLGAKVDLDQLDPDQLAPKSAYTSGAVRQKASEKLVPVWRFFNSATGAHFVTRDPVERDNVIANMSPPKGTFQFEGEAFMVANAPSPGLSPVHRFYNTQTGVHFYTISESERAHIVATMPQFFYEGIAYYASQVTGQGTTPFYRFYVPGKGFHFYTANEQERDNIIANLSAVYTYEGVGFSVLQSDWEPYREPVPRDVVVVGTETDEGSDDSIGKMWVNGVESRLPVGPRSGQSLATGVAFSGNNFIASGYYPYDDGPNGISSGARLWHNGLITQAMNAPTQNRTTATGISLAGSDIYVSGNMKIGPYEHPIYWKNNNIVYISDINNDSYSRSMAISVMNNDVYLAGLDYSLGANVRAVMWKNGVKTLLSDQLSTAFDIKIANSITYVAGSISYGTSNNYTAILWKNGTPQPLSDGTSNSTVAMGVHIAQNGDVYVVGIEKSNNRDHARLWKNGVLQRLENTDGDYFSEARDVVVAGDDVYVVGSVGAYSQKNSALWINGKLHKLSSGPSNPNYSSNTIATGVAVK